MLFCTFTPPIERITPTTKVANARNITTKTVTGPGGFNYMNAATNTSLTRGVATAGIIISIVAAPEVIIGAAVIGGVYGITSAMGGSDWIDKQTGDWGRKIIYSKP
jgi:hypothetical protein